jgi:hypothetical protein
MLLVDRLAGHTQNFGDRLPRPTQLAGVVDMEFLKLLY